MRRQKANAKLRRLSAFDRRRPSIGNNMNGNGNSAGANVTTTNDGAGGGGGGTSRGNSTSGNDGDGRRESKEEDDNGGRSEMMRTNSSSSSSSSSYSSSSSSSSLSSLSSIHHANTLYAQRVFARQQRLTLEAEAENAREYFAADRFQRGREVHGHWLRSVDDPSLSYSRPSSASVSSSSSSSSASSSAISAFATASSAFALGAAAAVAAVSSSMASVTSPLVSPTPLPSSSPSSSSSSSSSSQSLSSLSASPNTGASSTLSPSLFPAASHACSSSLPCSFASSSTGSCCAPSVSSFDWRLDVKLRTVAVALCLCLNIGTDPPGASSASSSSEAAARVRMECWIDPLALQPSSLALSTIGAALSSQYLRWQPKARIEIMPDPTIQSVKKTCVALRKAARTERVLFHYNGHGVPRPTTSSPAGGAGGSAAAAVGEVWVFDSSYTLYVPLALSDIMTWLGGPCIIVMDCAGAAGLIPSFLHTMKIKIDEAAMAATAAAAAETSGKSAAASAALAAAAPLGDYRECIFLAACSSSQSLPVPGASSSQLPADLFTSCLTTPLKMALHYFDHSCSMLGGTNGIDPLSSSSSSHYAASSAQSAPGHHPRTSLHPPLRPELLDRIPGRMNDRKTPLGELNWVYTAITDSIGWTLLPVPLFQKLFRADMLLSSLMRNYLLACRIMNHFECTPSIAPYTAAMPSAALIANHPLWACWDLVLEQYLLGLDKATRFAQRFPEAAAAALAAAAAAVTSKTISTAAPKEHLHFFNEHLTAFEVWLEIGGGVQAGVGGAALLIRDSTHANSVNTNSNNALSSSSFSSSPPPPPQLPIVLQVLLSAGHRRRALHLLARFMGRGVWSVRAALSVGIFPYVLKLLQSPDATLRELLVYTWAKILAVDTTCQKDIIKEKHEVYFINHLIALNTAAVAAGGNATPSSMAAADRQRVMSVFVIASLCHNDHVEGQRAVLKAGGMNILATLLSPLPSSASSLSSSSPLYPSPSLRKWTCLALGKLWLRFDDGQSLASSLGLHEKMASAMIGDPVPEVRTAALFALGAFINRSNSAAHVATAPATSGAAYIAPPSPSSPLVSNTLPGASRASPLPSSLLLPSSVPSFRDRHLLDLTLGKSFSQLVVDASPVVREELVLALAGLIDGQREEFASMHLTNTINMTSAPSSNTNSNMNSGGGGVSHGNHHDDHSNGMIFALNSVPPSPSHHGMQSPTSSMPANQYHAGRSAFLTSSTSNAPPTMSHGPLARATSVESNLSAPLTNARADNLHVSLSPNSGATVAANATPLSPLHLYSHASLTSPGPITRQSSLNNNMSGMWIANSIQSPSPSASAQSSFGAAQSNNQGGTPLYRPTMTRSTSGVNVREAAAAQAAAGGSMTHPSPSSLSLGSQQDTLTNQYRLSILRVLRTLSHDPHPSVSTSAMHVRRGLHSRAMSYGAAANNMMQLTPGPNGIYATNSGGSTNSAGGWVQHSSSSVQSSPLLSSIGALNTVPEASLNDYTLVNSSLPSLLLNSSSGASQHPHPSQHPSQQHPSPNCSPAHRRIRSDSSLSNVSTLTSMTAATLFDNNVITRPRSRNPSEADSHHGPPAPPASSNSSILSAMSASGLMAGLIASPLTASSSRQQSNGSNGGGGGSGNATVTSSPVHHATLAPGQRRSNAAAASASASERPSAASSAGSSAASSSGSYTQRLSIAFDYEMKQDVASSNMNPFYPLLSPSSVVSLPTSTIYSRSCEYFIAPTATASTGGAAAGAATGGANNAASAASSAAAASSLSSVDLHGDPDSILDDLLRTTWRASRQSDLLLSAVRLRRDYYDVSDRGSFDQIAALATGFDSVSSLLFHPYENLLAVSSNRAVALWDLNQFVRVNQFSNANGASSRISSMQWINESQTSLLLVGSDDGSVKIWRNVHVADTQPELVSAWTALRPTAMRATSAGSSSGGNGPPNVALVLDWQQRSGHLLAAGGSDSIRCWDVEREICVLDLLVDADSYVTSLCAVGGSASGSGSSASATSCTAARGAGGLVFSGGTDGVVRMFDLRCAEHVRSSPTSGGSSGNSGSGAQVVSRHSGPVTAVRLQSPGASAALRAAGAMAGISGDEDEATLLSGGANGEIHLTDMRMMSSGGTSHSGAQSLFSSSGNVTSSSLLTFPAFDKPVSLDALAVHAHSPLFASGSRKQVVRIGDFRRAAGLGVSSVTAAGGGSGGDATGGSASAEVRTAAHAPAVTTLKFHKGFMGDRIGPVTTVMFHP